MARRDPPPTGGRDIGLDTRRVEGGQEVLTALRGANASIRGKDKKKMLTPWEKEERVWEGPDGFYISAMTTYADLKQEATLQGHCGYAHFRFIDAKVTYLYSLRDKDGVPKATIHFKPVEFLGKLQELDKYPNDQAHGNPDPSTMYAYMKSTAYDSSGSRPNPTYPDFVWEDRLCRILSVSGRGVWSSEGKGATYQEMVKEWVKSLAPTKKKKAAQAEAVTA
jgi:hypothetical protein